MFLERHPTAGRALASAFDQRHPACLNRFPPMRLQAFSTTPDPTGKPRSGRGHDAFGPCWIIVANTDCDGLRPVAVQFRTAMT